MARVLQTMAACEFVDDAAGGARSDRLAPGQAVRWLVAGCAASWAIILAGWSFLG